MRPATGLRIMAAVGALWTLTVLVMFVKGDPESGRLLVQLAVVAATVGLLAWAAYRLRIAPRRASFGGQAREAGLQARAGDPLGLLDQPFSLFHRAATARDLENTAWGPWHGRQVIVADYWYVPSSNASRDDYRRFVCVLDQARRGWPDLAVVPTSVATTMRDAVAHGGVDMESERFNRAFDVRTHDRRFASTLLDARMIEWLLQQASGVGFEVVDGRLMVFEPRRTSSVDDVRRVLERFDVLIEHVPAVVPALFPGGSPAATTTAAAPERPDR